MDLRTFAANRAFAVIVVACLAFLAPGASAATITWTGATNSNWSTATNWNLARAPQNGDDVVISAIGAFPTNQDLSGVTVKSLSVPGGAGFTIAGNPLGLQSSGLLSGATTTDMHIQFDIVLNGPATAAFTGGLNINFWLEGAISGTGGLTFSVTGVGGGFVLSGANTYSGATTIIAGSGLVQALGSPPLPTGTAVNVTSGNLVIQGPATIGSLAGSAATSQVVVQGAPGSAILTMGGDNTSTDFAGEIAGGNTELIKVGTGTMTLSGHSTNGGNLTVNGGRVDVATVNGTTAFTTTVNAPGTFGGDGEVFRPVTVNAGGVLAPGTAAATGILRTRTLTLAAGGVFAVDLNGTTPGTQYDQVVVDGSANISGASLQATFGSAPAIGQIFTILQTINGGTVTGTFGSITTPNVVVMVLYNPVDVELIVMNVAPGAPTIGTATPGAGQATIAFTAPAPNSGSAITGYTATCNPGNITAPGGAAATSIVVPGLTNGTPYTCSVTATNAAGTGPASGTVGVTPFTVPGAPTSVNAVAGNTQATVSFTAPASNGGSAITGYTVTSIPSGGVDSNAGSTSTSHIITGLSNGTAYTFTVVATNLAGPGVASAPSNSVTPAGVPGAPTAVNAVAGNAQATVTFTAPVSNGGSAITGYTVTSIPSGGVDGNAGSTSTSHIVTGLANGTAYTFTVVATNLVGPSVASTPSNSVTPAGPPGAPVLSGGAIPGNGQATINFTAPASNGGAAITGYTATCNPGNHTAPGGAAATSIAVSGLTNGTPYLCSVTATNAAGLTGPASGVVGVTPLAPAVTTFSGPSATGTGTVTVTFTGGGAGCTFNNAQLIGAPPGTLPVPPTLPAPNTLFPHGMFDFTAGGCNQASTLNFTIVYPSPLPAGTQYWKYGPTSADNTAHWYVLPATITGNTVTFSITDGGLGDDDLTQNGTIVDQGGPGVPGPGVVGSIPTLQEWALMLLALLLMFSGLYYARHRRLL